MINSFIDDNFRYVKAYIQKDAEGLASEIIRDKDRLDYYLEDGEMLVGYSITRNEPVSRLYGFECKVVRFSLARVSNIHTKRQEALCTKLLEHLYNRMKTEKAYYNLRIPTHVVDLMRAYNVYFASAIMCGGTVEEYVFNKPVTGPQNQDLRVFMPGAEYLDIHKQKLMDITYSSFQTYQGQYHISPLTAQRAGEIYENWIQSSITNISDDKVIVAEYENEPVGFVTIKEDDFAVEGILSAVTTEHRGLHVYRSMISYVINYAYDRNKAFISSTQFDNFVVQGTWNSLGLRPFYSIYNVHMDCLNK